MRNSKNALRVAAGCLLATVLACSLTDNYPAPEETQTAAASPTPEPTGTETPPPRPTSTPRPTATSTIACIPKAGSEAMQAIQEEVKDLLPGAQVQWFDDFLCTNLNYGWGVGYTNPNTQVTVSDGILTFKTREMENVWDGINRIEMNLRDGWGILVLFRFQERTSANLFICTGTWWEADYRRWGFELNNPPNPYGAWVGWEGTTGFTAGYVPAQVLLPETWYYLLIRLEEAGNVTMKIWERKQTWNSAEFHKRMNSGWEGLTWGTLFQVYDGSIQIDRFMEVAFAGEG